MSDERRSEPRKEVNLKSSIILNQRELLGTIVNISEHGALVRFDLDSNGDVSESDTGREVSLVIEDGGSSGSREGNVCRYLEYRSYRYLAIYFNRLYE